MPLKVALQMDPIGSVNINADSTFRIALEAQARGHQLFFYTPDRLTFVEGRVMARGWPIEVRREIGNHDAPAVLLKERLDGRISHRKRL